MKTKPSSTLPSESLKTRKKERLGHSLLKKVLHKFIKLVKIINNPILINDKIGVNLCNSCLIILNANALKKTNS